MKKLNFCYVIDDNEEQCEMMGNSICSVNQCFGMYDCMIYVVSLERNGSNEYQRIVDTVKKNSPKLPYEILTFDKRIAEILPMPIRSENIDYLGYNALSRFFVPYIVPCDNLFYIDNDIIILKDIYDKLTSFDYEHILMKMWKAHHYMKDSETDHLNSGFLYLNCKLWKKRKGIFRDIMNYFFDNLLKIKFMDQDCFAWIASEKYKEICICENDIAINNHHIQEGVEVFHGYGNNKNVYYWNELSKWEHK